MSLIIDIEVIPNDEGGHRDLAFEIPGLIDDELFDTYYFILAIEPVNSFQEVKNAVSSLLGKWLEKVHPLKQEHTVYLPIDFSDQYTGCLKVQHQGKLKLTYGYSLREGHSTNPLKIGM